MSIVSGPLGTLLVALVAIAALVVWLRRDRRYPGPRLADEDGIDREELEAAEREVRELDAKQRADEDVIGDDWGPGASRPRPPERL
ncbi:MAG TPA: hypothetical protein VF252_01965 [Gemmatimonadales bacterium]